MTVKKVVKATPNISLLNDGKNGMVEREVGWKARDTATTTITGTTTHKSIITTKTPPATPTANARASLPS